MRVAWVTDVHFNFVASGQLDRFLASLQAADCDAILVTGDIAEAPTLLKSLERFGPVPGRLYYVLGNHDFYRSRVGHVRARASESHHGTYLHAHPPVALTDEWGLVGVDGWADGGYGNARFSDLVFTDWYLIDDFREVDAISDFEARMRVVGAFANESADALRSALTAAAGRFPKLLVLTHVPPFAEAAGDDGSAMASLWVPWLACRATGEVLAQFADDHPDIELEVLCGHTHVRRVTHPRPNLTVRTGAATYGTPAIEKVWQLSG